VIRLVVATCSVDCEDRLTADLLEPTRLVTVRRDGSHYIREPKRSR
jgi:RecB family endonuclease NucS